MPFKTIQEIREANEAAGDDFFAWENHRYFRRTFETGVIDGEYFITGERRPQDPSDITLPRRRFTIRRAREDGTIETVGEFQEHASLGLAKKALKHDLGVTLQ